MPNDTRWIAFLRAINVGGHTVKMEKLRQIFVDIGFAHVETFIASGNVIFSAPETSAVEAEQLIADRLQQELGYAVATFIRTDHELNAVAAFEPFPRAFLTTGALYIGFLGGVPSVEACERVLKLRTNIDDFVIHGRELYWGCQTTISQSKISGALLEKALGMPMTMRNSTTVRKLAANYSGAA